MTPRGDADRCSDAAHDTARQVRAAATSPVVAASPRLERDGVTWSVYGGLAAWAWFLYGFGAMLPILVAEQGISRTVGGLHLTAQAVGGFLAGLLTEPLVRRRRRRGTVVLSGVGVASGLGLLLVGGPTLLTLLACLVVGTFGTLAVTAFNPVLSEHHGTAGPAAVSEANAAASAVGLVAPLVVGAGVQAGLGWRPSVLLGALAMLWVAWRFTRIAHPTASIDAGPAARTAERVALPLAYWPLVVTLMLCVGVEFSLSTWSADYLRTHLGLAESLSAAGVSAVVAGMAVGRLVVSRLALRVEARPMLVATIVICLAGWAVLWTATGPVQAVLGLVLTGLGVAGHFPLGFALLMAVSPGREDRAAGLASVFISGAIAVAPFALGALADRSDIHTAFLVVPGLLVTALTILAAVHVRRAWLTRGVGASLGAE